MVNRLYNAWCVFTIFFILLVLYPLIFIFLLRKSWHKYALKLNNFWADAWFFVIGIKVEKEFRFTPDATKQYIFVANHFSYLDVPIGMKIIRNHFMFMGKSSVKKIPLVGYMFAKMHIQVDRANKYSRAKSLEKCQKALKSGISLFIMPEGGIVSKQIPNMQLPLKDGAFILAIDAKVPIVPITLVNNYKIMPNFSIKNRQPARVIFHPEIETENMTRKNVEQLKSQVYEVIQGEINRNL